LLDPREPGRDSSAVARTLVTDARCVECIMSATGFDVDRVLGAISALEAHLRLIRTWGRCRSCSKKDRAILTVDVSSGSRRGPAVKYDGLERHSGLRCTNCGRPMRPAGQLVLLRRGQPYHKACAPGVRRPGR
jgi:hypothetical protein